MNETAHPLIVPVFADVGVSPAGSVSTTVTGPAEAPAPTLLTVTIYTSAASPGRKLPVWLLTIVKSAWAAWGGVKSIVSVGRLAGTAFSFVSNCFAVGFAVSLPVMIHPKDVLGSFTHCWTSAFNPAPDH